MQQVNSDYFSDKPQSFGGKYQLYSLFDKKEVDSALENNDIYSRFKKHKRSKKYSPIYVYKKRELFQSDVVFLAAMSSSSSDNVTPFVRPSVRSSVRSSVHVLFLILRLPAY